MKTKVTIDALTIIFIHILIINNKQSNILRSLDDNILLKRLIDMDALQLIMSLMSLENIQIREHAMRLLQVLIYVNEDFKNHFEKSNGYKLLIEKL